MPDPAAPPRLAFRRPSPDGRTVHAVARDAFDAVLAAGGHVTLADGRLTLDIDLDVTLYDALDAWTRALHAHPTVADALGPARAVEIVAWTPADVLVLAAPDFDGPGVRVVPI